ncbi:E3 ubiquitin-protein ligase RNF4-like protein [Drosera capensis]
MSAKVSRTVPLKPPRNPHRGKNNVTIDLNLPAMLNHIEEGTSSRPPDSHGSHAAQRGEPPQPTFIDLDSFDDDVVVSSASAFAEAKNNARRNRRRNIVDVDSEEVAISVPSNGIKRRRVPPKQPTINCDAHIIRSTTCVVMTAMLPPPPVAAPPPPPSPKEPAFSCPVCMGPLVEEMSTKCGHIFCKSCIQASIHAQKKCPTCRRKLAMKDIIRVYLPTTRSGEADIVEADRCCWGLMMRRSIGFFKWPVDQPPDLPLLEMTPAMDEKRHLGKFGPSSTLIGKRRGTKRMDMKEN